MIGTMDTRTLLLAAAAEGPHLRAVVEAAREGLFADLPAPRSVVLVTGEARARLAAEAVVALADDARAPVVVCGALPPFAGALDLVVVLTDDPGDAACAAALVEAARRGCATVLIDPGEGPVRAACDPSTVVAPRPAMADRGSFCGYLGAAFAALTGAGVTGLGPAAVLSDVADAVDAEAMVFAPDRDQLVNPARELGHWMRGRSMVFGGLGERWRTVAELSAAWMLDAGVPAHGTALPDFGRALRALTPVERDIFHDPDFDGPVADPLVLPLGAIIVTSPADHDTAAARLGHLPWVRVEAPALEVELRHPLVDVCVTAVRMAAAAAYVVEED